jgi:putative phosphoesterase
MKLGIIADTHDRLPYIDKAVQKLNREKVELVLHAGDYSAPFVTSQFKPLQAKMIGVFGNNDAEKSLLKQNFEAIGVQIRGRFAEVKADGLKVALLHGEEADLLESLINTGAYDVVLYGHTHQAGTRRQGKTLVVNPGEVCGYLSERATFALLDTETMDVRFISI